MRSCFVSSTHRNRIDKEVIHSLCIYFIHHFNNFLIQLNTQFNLFDTTGLLEIMLNLQKLMYSQRVFCQLMQYFP